MNPRRVGWIAAVLLAGFAAVSFGSATGDKQQPAAPPSPALPQTPAASPPAPAASPPAEVTQPNAKTDPGITGDVPMPTAEAPPPTAHPPMASQQREDPFSTTPQMELEAQRLGLGPAVMTSTGTRIQLPEMRLQGSATDAQGKTVAMLKVGGAEGMAYFLRQGETLTLAEQGQAISLEVQEISEDGRYLKIGAAGETLTIR